VLGDLTTTCRSVANAAACAVLSIDYRLAPGMLPRRWTTATPRRPAEPRRRADPAAPSEARRRQLTAVVAQLARDRGSAARFQPWSTRHRRHHDIPSCRENATGYFLARRHALVHDHHLGDADR
jgi:acetyl esterase/lipase